MESEFQNRITKSKESVYLLTSSSHAVTMIMFAVPDYETSLKAAIQLGTEMSERVNNPYNLHENVENGRKTIVLTIGALTLRAQPIDLIRWE